MPWEHYIPVADDLSDLVARIEWLRADDDRARRLAESALRVGRQAATKSAVFCFFARALDALRALPRAMIVAVPRGLPLVLYSFELGGVTNFAPSVRALA